MDDEQPEKSGKGKLKLTQAMQRKLSDVAPDKHQVAQGPVKTRKTVQEVIIEKMAEAACEGKQWAIESFLQYMEGKPIQQTSNERDDQATYDRISKTATDHLNAIATRKKAADSKRSAAKAGDQTTGTGAAPKPARTARSLLGLSGDGDSDPKDH
jgi:hypothetical protein